MGTTTTTTTTTATTQQKKKTQFRLCVRPSGRSRCTDRVGPGTELEMSPSPLLFVSSICSLAIVVVDVVVVVAVRFFLFRQGQTPVWSPG